MYFSDIIMTSELRTTLWLEERKFYRILETQINRNTINNILKQTWTLDIYLYFSFFGDKKYYTLKTENYCSQKIDST